MAELVAVLLNFLKAIGNYRWYAIGISWLVALGGWGYVHSMPDEYQATARVYVDTQSILKPLMASMTTMPNVEQQVMFMRRTLISRPNVERVMRMVDLDIKAATPREQEEMVDKLMTQIKMGGTERDDIYTISYTSSNPKTGREVVQSLLTIFVEGSFGGKKLDSEKAIQFIDEQIRMYEERLAVGENALKEFKIRNMGMLPRQGMDYAGGYAELADKLSQAKLELLEAEQARNAIRRQITGDEMAPVGGAVVAESANPELDERIAAIEKQLDTLRLQYTEQHPDIVSNVRLLGLLQARKKDEAKQMRVGDPGANFSPMLQQMNVALSVEEAKLASLQARVTEYTNRLAQMRSHSNMAPEIEAQLTQLNRDYAINKENYEKLVQRRESAKLSGDLSTATDMMSFRVVDPPTASRTPVGPNRLRLYSIVLLVALVAGLGAALLMSQVRPTFLSQRSLRDITGIPVLGAISMNWTDTQKVKRRRRLIGFGMAILSLASAYGGILALTLFRSA
ncbi:XrtA system polysaccharide chain length determinant [Pseudoduganella plicata]|uniref:Chain-length determining protein n=1 Tax=Pseudoduganella plicata TaxID=321984 RepID=A0A4P7BGG7_9BURK|nr:XrtA system polysaccharide chain length determinant [Pseudoduganella plicata]QBQ37343.1 chain length-determining protein [Pseudoduganella plicata]GGZ09033.1 chain-length determining protein [Pseudoduganella plicata]